MWFLEILRELRFDFEQGFEDDDELIDIELGFCYEVIVGINECRFQGDRILKIVVIFLFLVIVLVRICFLRWEMLFIFLFVL